LSPPQTHGFASLPTYTGKKKKGRMEIDIEREAGRKKNFMFLTTGMLYSPEKYNECFIFPYLFSPFWGICDKNRPSK
jgi:hypothetical protein